MINFLAILVVPVVAAFGCRSVRSGINDSEAHGVEAAADAGFIQYPEWQVNRESIIVRLARYTCLIPRSVMWSRPSSTAALKHLGAGFAIGAATLAECGPGSKYAYYLRYLTTAKGFKIDEAPLNSR